MASETNETREKSLNFLEEIIEESIAGGETRIQTRFPPEPNGYLHIGHAKSTLHQLRHWRRNTAASATCASTTRTPSRRTWSIVDSIKRDIQWLGFQWDDWSVMRRTIFDQLYEMGRRTDQEGAGLRRRPDAGRDPRKPRHADPCPERPQPVARPFSVEENLDLFTRMKNGEFPDGAKVLRAKIDMAHPNMLFRDPIMYRIIHAEHHRTGDKWCIYPMYDLQHHVPERLDRAASPTRSAPWNSTCTVRCTTGSSRRSTFSPRTRYEFARLNLTYTMMSKRKLSTLCAGGRRDGLGRSPHADDLAPCAARATRPPRCATSPRCVGVAKRDNVIDLGKLEYCVREDLNRRRPARAWPC